MATAVVSLSSKDVSHVVKFNGTNFPFWKFQLCLVLEQYDLVPIVFGDEPKPRPITITDANGVSTTNDAEIKAWCQKDNSARNGIVASLELERQRALINCKTAHEMWKKLSSQYEQVAEENQHALIQRFYDYQYDKEKSVMDHVTAVETFARQLEDIGAPLTEAQIITKILYTLPPSFRQVISAWKNVDKPLRTLELLTSRIIEEDELNKRYGEEGTKNDAAFFANRGGASSNQANRGRRNVTCTNCGRRGHTEDKCWDKAKQANGAQAKFARGKPTQQDTPQQWSGDYAFRSASFPSRKTRCPDDTWYADSGASQHMTDQRWAFSQFQSIKPGSWPVTGIGENRQPLQVHGFGTVPVTGEVEGVHLHGTLQSVLYVPNLGVNLFSVRSATRNGYNVHFSGQGVKIIKNDKVFAVGSIENSNLYLLNLAICHNNFRASVNTDIPTAADTSTGKPMEPFAALAKTKSNSIQVWHRRLGHVCLATIKKMAASGMVDGLEISKGETVVTFCEGCILGKQHRLPFPGAGRTRAEKIGGLIHSDICGPVSVSSPGGAKYFVTFKDDFSGYCVINFIKQKSEVFLLFKQFVKRVETEFGNPVDTLRSDNGGEYVGNDFKRWMLDQGIRHETSAPYTPQQNGVAERVNRTILESARSMLHSSSLPLELWAEAANCAVYILNRVATKAVEGKTPYEVWRGVKPNVSHIREFGSIVYVHIRKEKRDKFEPKSVKCIHVGYCETQKAFRAWDPNSKKVVISRDVIFQELPDERTVPAKQPSILDLVPDILEKHPDWAEIHPAPVVPAPGDPVQVDPVPADRVPVGSVQVDPVPIDPVLVDPVPVDPVLVDPVLVDPVLVDPVLVGPVLVNPVLVDPVPGDPVPDDPALGDPVQADPVVRDPAEGGPLEGLPGANENRTPPPLPPGTRVRRPPIRWIEESTNEYYAGMATVGEFEEPATFKEATTCPQAEFWMAAMAEEMEALEKNQTWTLTTLPAGRQPIQNRWVYKLKLNGDGGIRRYKARLVAKGFTQRPGIDFDETFSPVVKHDSLRVVISLTAAMGLKMLQLDVKTAFLNGDLNEELFMEQPIGFVNPDRRGAVCKLNRSLYGLKQAPRAWNLKFHNSLTGFGFVRSSADPCVYVLKETGCLTIIAIWVDDGLVCSSSSEKLAGVVNYLAKNFEMTSGPAECFVGVQIMLDQDQNTIRLSQENYINRLLQKFNLLECATRAVPADPFSRLSKELGRESTDNKQVELASVYREAVGSLIYIVTCTRPDVAFAVSQVSQFTNNPTTAHWDAVKRIFSYLKGTLSHGITFGASANSNCLQAFSDADFASSLDDRRSTSGVILVLNGGPVSWKSQRQKCISLSTTESEYVAATAAAKEVVWMRRLLEDIGCSQNQPTVLHIDNQSAIRLIRNPEFHQRTKHIDVKYHFIRDLQESKVIDAQYVCTENQLADLLTKGLDGPRFRKLRSEIGVCDM